MRGKSGTLVAMSKRSLLPILASLSVLAFLVYQIPSVHTRLAWRFEILTTYLHGLFYPARPVPTAVVPETPWRLATLTPTTVAPLPVTGPSSTPAPTARPLPAQVSLPVPAHEQQTMNNCGPATLTMALRMYGWNGTQKDIAQVIKPVDADRNVNPEEMRYYILNYAGWLRAEYRVGGDLFLLKRLLAAGYAPIIEETFIFDSPYWPNDDLWAAHYLLLTGYDDTAQTFTAQDSYHGPNQQIAYSTVLKNWTPFNYVYMLIYLPEQESEIRALLGSDWDEAGNRQKALTLSEAATVKNPQDAYAWFNLGTNLVYFERYGEAAQAYDKARALGLPQRMFRYQFGPFIAYFHSYRMDDLMTLTTYALQRTPNSEEALLWKGWGLYRQGDTAGALAAWQKALRERPGYPDAQYAIDFVKSQP